MAEKNPLQINTEESVRKIVNKYKNWVGRPTKKNEIKFSTQPKSIISILLNKDKINVVNQTTSDTKLPSKLQGQIIKELSQVFSLKRKQIKGTNSNNNVNMQWDNLYKCNHADCSYTTKFPCNLKTHKRTHTTEQPYVCDECTFRSKFISSLKTHKRLHRDEKPFACQHCKYKCNSVSNLKKHCSRKHKVNNNNN